MVEFALVAPLLFFLIFGIIDFGRAIFYANEVTNAAREGARIAILDTNPCNTTVSQVGTCATSGPGRTVCDGIEENASLISVWSCGDPNDPPGFTATIPSSGSANTAYVEIDQSTSQSSCPAVPSPTHPDGAVSTWRQSGNYPIRVTIDYFYRPLTPIVSSLFPSTFYISSTVCARPEY